MADPVLPAARLGHFQLLAPLGRGGMGAVFSAYDLRLDRKVAIKVLTRPRADDRDAPRSQRLLREAQAMAKLSHPNVVPVYEVGVDHGTLFLAMEYVVGQTLDRWVKAAPRSWREVVEVFVQAGRGLAAAHDAGIVHRDFKPSNVLVDDRGQVRVTDFGIALVHATDSSDGATPPSVRPAVPAGIADVTPASPATPLTEQGTIMGTPGYMSPEQYGTAAVDARSDQFSYCVALYEALFGKRPFPGRGKELADQVVNGRVDRPDPGAPVPGRITAIVLRGLSTDPAARFPSMTALVAALADDPSRRRRQLALTALGGVAVAAIAAGLGWAVRADDAGDAACTGAADGLTGAWDDAVRAAVTNSLAATDVAYAAASADRVAVVLDRYRADWIAARTEACRATRIRREASERVLDLRNACLDRRRGELRALTTLLAATTDASGVEQAVEAASSLPPPGACADTAALIQPGAAVTARGAELRAELDRLSALDRLGRYREALAPARALVAAARTADDTGVLAEALRLEGRFETKTADFAAAEATLAEAIGRARQIGDADLFADAALDLVDALTSAGIAKSREALGIVRVARAVIADTHDPALPIRLLVAHGDIHLTLAHPAEALPLLREAAERCRRTLGADHVLLFQVQSVLAPALGYNQLHAEALAEFDALVDGMTRVLGPVHPTTLGVRIDRCRAMAEANEMEKAVACFTPALADVDRVIGADRRTAIVGRTTFGLALEALGRAEEARAVLAEALRHVTAQAWAEQWYVAIDAARTLGRLEVRLGDHRAALAHCEQAKAAIGEQHVGLDVEVCIGEALLGLGEEARALAALAVLAPKADPMFPAHVGAWHFAHARALWAVRRDAAGARALAEQARGLLTGEARARVDAWLATVPRR